MYISVKGYPKKDPNNSLPGQLAPDNQLPRSFIHYRAKRAAKHMTPRLNVIQIILHSFILYRVWRSGASCLGLIVQGASCLTSHKKNKYTTYVWMQETTQRIKLRGLLLPDLLVKESSYQTSLKCYRTKLIARLVLRRRGKIYWPTFQLAELVFRVST